MRIIYFDIDSLRPDHLGCYGYDRPTSPNIDAVAAQGMCFDRCYASDSPCMPSRHALISGRFGINNGVVTHGGPFSKMHLEERVYGGPAPDNQLLQRRLREGGVDTISFSNFPYRHCANWFSFGWTEAHSPDLQSGSETAPTVNHAVLNWLRRNDDRDDYFLHLNYWDAHRTYRMDASWADRFDDMPVSQTWPDEAAIAGHQTNTGPFSAQRQFKDNVSTLDLMPGAVRNRAEFEQMVTGYDASIAFVDHHVGLILAELESQGGLQDTAIIIGADHGDAFGEHGIYSDHTNADESIHRLPLIVKWPGVTPAGSRDGSMVYHLDMAPTLCELTGAEIPSRYDGRSLARHLQGTPDWDRDYLVWTHGLYTLQRGVRTRDHLLLKTWDDHGYPFAPTQLYDMNTDPYMSTDLSPQAPEVVDRLNTHYQTWLDEQSAGAWAIPDPLMGELERRRSLGT
ncbi:MAG: sulfatase [Gemmatimonadetes bacterium]|nr:sulfatase [Gemmatimonadota bacterium]MBT7858978.1 sulfatase [Gemmatimonadota bacterium]